MSVQSTKQRTVELDVGAEGIDAITTAIDQLLMQSQQQRRSSHYPNRSGSPHQNEWIPAVKRFRRRLTECENPLTGVKITIGESEAQVIRGVLAQLYVQHSPSDTETAQEQLEGKDIEGVAALLAGWGHRASV